MQERKERLYALASRLLAARQQGLLADGQNGQVGRQVLLPATKLL
jgi:hypothetical protein